VIARFVEDVHTRPLVVVPEPARGTRSILAGTADQTIVMAGDGHAVHVCGRCGAPLLQGVTPSLLFTMLVRCGRCGTHNARPA
jgi:hypothetical protein